MKHQLSPDNHSFHLQMLSDYYELLTQVEQEGPFDPASIEKIFQRINQQDSLDEKEQEFHQQFLNRIGHVRNEIQTLHWMSQHLKVLHELRQTFAQTFDKHQIYKKAHELVSRVMDTDAFCIAFYDEGDEEISIPFSIDNGKRYAPMAISLGEGYISQVITTKETVHIKSTVEMEPDRYIKWGNPDQDTGTCIFVPMMLNNQIKGVISAQNYHEFAYREEHEELLRIIGIQVTSAIETAKLYDKVYDMSIKDDLTSLKNSRAFHRDLEELLSTEDKQDIALLMFDSDSLKKVNDMYGHHVGDLHIKHIGQVLKKYLSEGEEAYRYAGDEFMIIAPKLSLEKAKQKAFQIQKELQNDPIQHEGRSIQVSVSVGIASYPTHAVEADELKRVADAALYNSKNHGKNNVTIFQKGLIG